MITEAANEGIGIFTGSSYVNVTNCNISNSYSNGIAVWSAMPSISYGVIQGNTISNFRAQWNWCVSEEVQHDWTIQNNVIYSNSSVPANNPYTAGINITGSSVSNITMQNNTVYSNGLGQPTNNIGFGIHVDVQSANNIIRGKQHIWQSNDCNILVEIYRKTKSKSMAKCCLRLDTRMRDWYPWCFWYSLLPGIAVYNNTIVTEISPITSGPVGFLYTEMALREVL